MIFVLFINIVMVLSQCDSEYNIYNNQTEKILSLDNQGNLNIKNNITTNGYCNCKTPFVFNTYTPIMGDDGTGTIFTLTESIGVYSITGNMIFLQVYISWNNSPDLVNGYIFITLPVKGNPIIQQYTATISFINGISFDNQITIGTQSFFTYNEDKSGRLYLYNLDNVGGSALIPSYKMSSSGILVFSINYFT